MGQWCHHFGSRRCPGLTMLVYRILGSSVLQYYATFLKDGGFQSLLTGRSYIHYVPGSMKSPSVGQHPQSGGRTINIFRSRLDLGVSKIHVLKKLCFSGWHYWEVIEIQRTEQNETIFKSSGALYTKGIMEHWLLIFSPLLHGL